MVVGISSEVGELLIRVIEVVAEYQVIQLVFLDLFFQPRNVFGKILAFQSYLDVYLIAVFFAQGTQAFHVSGKFVGQHTDI